MKVLQVNSLFREGSTGKIMADIHDVLKQQGYKSVVCYSKGKVRKAEPNVHKIFIKNERLIHRYANRIFGFLMYGGLYRQTKRLLKIIGQETPDVVHLHCINGNSFNVYKLLTFLAFHKINTIVTNHGEFYYTGSCGHAFECDKWKSTPGCGKCPRVLFSTGSHTFDWSRLAWKEMKKAFDKIETDKIIISSVSSWVKNRSIQSPIVNRFEHTVVLNGLDTNIFHYYENVDIFSSKFENSGKVVFHATAIFEPEDAENLKGGNYIVDLAMQMPEVNFIVAAVEYRVTKQLPANLVFWGSAKSQIELAKLYSAANCTLLVSKRETFSMPTAESLCCGTPIVAFKAGGPESFAPKDVADFVDFGDVTAMKIAIEKRLKTQVDKKMISEKAITLFSKEVMANNYIELYKKLHDKNKNI